jgi:hypothetical protein
VAATSIELCGHGMTGGDNYLEFKIIFYRSVPDAVAKVVIEHFT